MQYLCVVDRAAHALSSSPDDFDDDGLFERMIPIVAAPVAALYLGRDTGDVSPFPALATLAAHARRDDRALVAAIAGRQILRSRDGRRRRGRGIRDPDIALWQAFADEARPGCSEALVRLLYLCIQAAEAERLCGGVRSALRLDLCPKRLRAIYLASPARRERSLRLLRSGKPLTSAQIRGL